jgi:hypothetical protein
MSASTLVLLFGTHEADLVYCTGMVPLCPCVIVVLCRYCLVSSRAAWVSEV